MRWGKENKEECRWKMLLKDFDAMRSCCDVCESKCKRVYY